MGARASEPAFSASSAAAHIAEPTQAADVKAKQKRIPDESIAKLVAEENESKNKFPAYPGLERWELIEKMGDGAFSNVYRARDREGTAGEVAIKVVRKYEMNSMQVCDNGGPVLYYFAHPPFLARLPFLSIQVPLPTLGLNARAINISIPTSNQRLQRLQRCENFSFIIQVERQRLQFSRLEILGRCWRAVSPVAKCRVLGDLATSSMRVVDS